MSESRQATCDSGLPRFLIGCEDDESRELEDTDMRNISRFYGEDEDDEDQVMYRDLVVSLLTQSF